MTIKSTKPWSMALLLTVAATTGIAIFAISNRCPVTIGVSPVDGFKVQVSDKCASK